MPRFSCPKCKGELENQAESYFCTPCQIKYRKFVGIPNFKEQELYPGEWELLEEAAKRYNRSSFIELLEYMDSTQEKNVLPWEQRRYQRFDELQEENRQKHLNSYIEEGITRPGEIQLQITNTLIDKAGYNLKRDRCLDIGCGRGPWIVAAANMFDTIYALDVDMASLIIARKYCDEKQISNINFLSATSSSLPFAEDYFDLVNSQAVLEHVDNQADTMGEINRVLKSQGCFTGDSVNKYNLFTPEPHINLRLVTFLPKKLAHRISLWLKGYPYDDLKPLTYNELRLLLKQTFGNRFQIIPFVETSEKCLTYSVMKLLPSWLLDIFTHTHYIIASKNNG